MKLDKKTIISLIMAFFLVGSILAIVVGNDNNQNTQSFTYNGHEFEVMQDHYLMDGEVKIYNSPATLENMTFNSTAIDLIKGTRMVWITAPVKGANMEFIGLATFELAEIFNDQGLYAVQAISDDNTDYNRPLITCTNSTPMVPVINFKYSNQTKIWVNGSCIHADAETGYDAVMLKDILALKYLGVI